MSQKANPIFVSTVGLGDEPSQCSDSSGSMDCSPVPVKSVYISSAILAAKSPFFYKVRHRMYIRMFA